MSRHGDVIASAQFGTAASADDWRNQARCRRMPEADIDEVFFPVGEAALTRALPVAMTYCAGCPAFGPCLVLGMGEADGIFAGMSPAARRSLGGGRRRVA